MCGLADSGSRHVSQRHLGHTGVRLNFKGFACWRVDEILVIIVLSHSSTKVWLSWRVLGAVSVACVAKSEKVVLPGIEFAIVDLEHSRP